MLSWKIWGKMKLNFRVSKIILIAQYFNWTFRTHAKQHTGITAGFWSPNTVSSMKRISISWPGPLAPSRPSRRKVLTVANTLIQSNSWISTLYFCQRNIQIFSSILREQTKSIPQQLRWLLPPTTCFKVCLSDNLCSLEIHKLTKSSTGWSKVEVLFSHRRILLHLNEKSKGIIVDEEQNIIKIRRNVVSYSATRKSDGATSVTAILRICMSAWFLGRVICIHFSDFTILHHLEECLYISYGFEQALLFLLSLISYFYSSQGFLNQQKKSVQGTYEEMVWKRRKKNI